MDLNLVVLAGRLAAPPEIRRFETGIRTVRYLVAIRSDKPTPRVDVVPVTAWDPEESVLADRSEPGSRLWVAGGVQRRFWDKESGRRSRLEIVAHQVEIRDGEEEASENC